MSGQAGAFGIKVGDSTGVGLSQGFFYQWGTLTQRQRGGCGVYEGFGEGGSQSYERVER